MLKDLILLSLIFSPARIKEEKEKKTFRIKLVVTRQV